jgi:hypothetical protein
MTHTSGLMPVPLFSFTNVPRQPVKVPSAPGAPVFVVLMMGRLAVTLVNSEFGRSPLVPPPNVPTLSFGSVEGPVGARHAAELGVVVLDVAGREVGHG